MVGRDRGGCRARRVTGRELGRRLAPLYRRVPPPGTSSPLGCGIGVTEPASAGVPNRIRAEQRDVSLRRKDVLPGHRVRTRRGDQECQSCRRDRGLRREHIKLACERSGAPILGNLCLCLLDGSYRDDAGPCLALHGPGQRPTRSVSWIFFRGTVAGGLATLAKPRDQSAGPQIAEAGKLVLDSATSSPQVGQPGKRCHRGPPY